MAILSACEDSGVHSSPTAAETTELGTTGSTDTGFSDPDLDPEQEQIGDADRARWPEENSLDVQNYLTGKIGNESAVVRWGVEGTSAACSGVIIGKRHFLTAAHCIEDMVKEPDLENGSSPKRVWIIRKNRHGEKMPKETGRAKLFIHPAWNNGGSLFTRSGNDIGVVAFKSLLQTPSGLRKARNRRKIFRGYADVNDIFRAWGWGVYDTSGKGSGELRSALFSPSRVTNRVMETRHTARICVGDSGGPVYKRVNGENIVTAVISGYNGANDFCSEPGDPVYTARTLKAFPWIEEIMRLHFGDDFSCESNSSGTICKCW